MPRWVNRPIVSSVEGIFSCTVRTGLARSIHFNLDFGLARPIHFHLDFGLARFIQFNFDFMVPYQLAEVGFSLSAVD
jgi:hypothetical protein